MNKATLAAVGFGLLALAACGRGDQDRLNTADVNEMESLDELSNDAANVAAEAEALQNQAANLQEEAQSTENVQQDEDIQGM